MPKVYWDKGHGGSDAGAVGNGLQEKVLTHKIVEYAMAYMDLMYENVQQRESRPGDETRTLAQRTNDANSWGANVFISVHINSSADASANGFESYVYNNLGSERSPTISLQNSVHDEVVAALRSFGVTRDRGKKQANFHVLRESNMIALLTENLFIVNPSEANLLRQENFLRAIGEAHARGVAKYFGLNPKTAPAAAPQVEPVFFHGGDVVAKVRVIGDNVNIHTAPDANSAVTRKAVKGEIFDVYGNLNDWHAVGGANWVLGNNGRDLSLISYRVIVDNLSYPQARDLVPELQRRFGDNNVWGEPK